MAAGSVTTGSTLLGPAGSVIAAAGLADKFPAPGIIPYIVEHKLPDGGSEFTLTPSGFHESFCADIPADDAAFAIAQRPLAGVALTEAAPTPASS